MADTRERHRGKGAYLLSYSLSIPVLAVFSLHIKREMEKAGAKQRVLVVEDDDQVAYLLRYILERDGFAVHLARDGRSAQRQIANLAPPDLVMLDVMLPDVDGFQLLASIRRKSEWKDVPVLMLTAKSQDKDIERAREGGANDYIFKPFKPDDLRARIRQLVNYGS